MRDSAGTMIKRDLMEPEPILVPKKMGARLLGVCERTLDYLLAAKLLTPRRVGRKVLLNLKELQEFAQEDHEGPAGIRRASRSSRSSEVASPGGHGHREVGR